MDHPPQAIHASLESLYERLTQAFALGSTDDSDVVAEIRESIVRIQACLDAPLRQGSLPLEMRRRFDLAAWLPKIHRACEDAGVQEESSRSSLARTLGERLVKLHAMIDLMNEEEDLPDLRDHLVFAYVEAKSEWQQLNGIINYGIARGGTPSPETLARAVLISLIIADLDDLFGAENIEVLTDYLFAPLPNAHELTLRRHALLA